MLKEEKLKEIYYIYKGHSNKIKNEKIEKVIYIKIYMFNTIYLITCMCSLLSWSTENSKMTVNATFVFPPLFNVTDSCRDWIGSTAFFTPCPLLWLNLIWCAVSLAYSLVLVFHLLSVFMRWMAITIHNQAAVGCHNKNIKYAENLRAQFAVCVCF